jgi:hypothetical protein
MRFMVGFAVLLIGFHTGAWAQGKGIPGKELSQ